MYLKRILLILIFFNLIKPSLESQKIGRKFGKLKVIGILSYNSKVKNNLYPSNLYNIIPGSYAEWIYESNAQVVFINYDEPNIITKEKMDKINGILFTGGPSILFERKSDDSYNYSKKTNFTKKVEFIIRNAVKLNNENKKFSLFGICLGFQSMVLYFSNYKMRLNIVNNINKSNNSKINKNNFNILSENLVDSASSLFEIFKTYIESNKKYLYFNHKEGITKQNFNSFKNLRNNFHILSTLKLDNNKNIVTMVKHKRYPFVGIQFHPEKVQFENKKGINIHETLEGRFISFMFSNIFSRLNNRYSKLNNEEFRDLNIKNQNEEISTGVYNTIFYIPKFHHGNVSRQN